MCPWFLATVLKVLLKINILKQIKSNKKKADLPSGLFWNFWLFIFGTEFVQIFFTLGSFTLLPLHSALAVLSSPDWNIICGSNFYSCFWLLKTTRAAIARGILKVGIGRQGLFKWKESRISSKTRVWRSSSRLYHMWPWAQRSPSLSLSSFLCIS